VYDRVWAALRQPHRRQPATGPIGSKALRPIYLFARVFPEDGNTQTTYNHVMATTRSAVIDSNAIMSNILVIRGHRVLLDSDLAALYQVETKAITRAVRRNAERFPGDFMFQLAAEESGSLRSQFGALKTGRGKHRKYAPYVFTEQGAPYRAVYVARQAVSMSSARTSKFMQNAINTWPTHMISAPNRDGNARSP
jgi:hypothetical protein